MLKTIVLLMLTFQVYATDCYKLLTLNKRPSEFLRNFDRYIPGTFANLSKQTTDGFFFYNGIARISGKGHELGRILYKYYEDDKILFISHIEAKVKDRKIGTALMAMALKRHPETQIIRSNLGLRNFELFKQAKDKGQSDLKALQQTMAYKMRKRLGFQYIIKNSIDVEIERHSVVFAVSRFKD